MTTRPHRSPLKRNAPHYQHDLHLAEIASAAVGNAALGSSSSNTARRLARRYRKTLATYALKASTTEFPK